jgi:hypothetical protein
VWRSDRHVPRWWFDGDNQLVPYDEFHGELGELFAACDQAIVAQVLERLSPVLGPVAAEQERRAYEGAQLASTRSSTRAG